MKKKIFVFVLAVLFGAGFFTPAMAQDTIGIGLCTPMSGGAASWGKKAESGTIFAIERINAAGGVKAKGETKARML